MPGPYQTSNQPRTQDTSRLLPETVPQGVHPGGGGLDRYPTLKNPEAPLTPFATPQYRLAASAEAERLDAKAGAEAAVATRNIQRATNYVLCVVLFSAGLFFGGISTRVENPRARAIIVVIGCLILVGALAWITTFPISLSI
jgi:hypothetical protein